MITIYMLLNTINGKFYIGQTKNLAKRMNCHKSSTSCRKIKRAIDKYGFNNFTLNILHCVDSKKEANALEIYEINNREAISKGYNIRPGGNKEFSKETCALIKIKAIKNRHITSKRFRKVWLENRNKMMAHWCSQDFKLRHSIATKAGFTEEVRLGCKNRMLGTKKSEDFKNTLSKSMKNRKILWADKISKSMKGKKPHAKTIAAAKKAHIGVTPTNAIKVKCSNGLEFNSIREAADYVKMPRSSFERKMNSEIMGLYFSIKPEDLS